MAPTTRQTNTPNDTPNIQREYASFPSASVTFQASADDATAAGNPLNAGPSVASYASSWSHDLPESQGRFTGFGRTFLPSPPPPLPPLPFPSPDVSIATAPTMNVRHSRSDTLGGRDGAVGRAGRDRTFRRGVCMLLALCFTQRYVQSPSVCAGASVLERYKLCGRRSMYVERGKVRKHRTVVPSNILSPNHPTDVDGIAPNVVWGSVCLTFPAWRRMPTAIMKA